MASRYLNGWIFNQYDKMNQEELLNILMKIKFRDAEINGVSIYLTAFNGKQIYSVPLKFFAQTNKVQKALINPSFSVNINSKIFKRVCTNSPIQKFSYADWIEFFPDGKIKVLFFEKGDLNFSETCIDYEGYNYLEFDHNQKLIKKESLNDSTRIWSW